MCNWLQDNKHQLPELMKNKLTAAFADPDGGHPLNDDEGILQLGG
jgi:hypothetical protein